MAHPNRVRPNPVQDYKAFELWVCWCHPWIYQEWIYWSGPDTLSLWYWAEERCPHILAAFKNLTWKV